MIAWQEWREETEDVCALPLVRRVAALLDQDPGALRAGQTLPQFWHMVLFTPTAPQATLGVDGHPTGQAQFAPAGLPRRVLGGRRTRFHGALTIGAEVRRVSTVAGVVEKQGRSGRLAVVTLRHAIVQCGEAGPAVVEEQDIVYREAGSSTSGAGSAPEQAAAQPTLSRTITPDPAMLFRYSAITFNAHRIHYDAPYARDEEAYPGLVVNGGLTALLLVEMLKRVAGRPLAWFEARNRRPLFCGRPARLCLAPSGEGWSLWAEDDRGRVALEASGA